MSKGHIDPSIFEPAPKRPMGGNYTDPSIFEPAPENRSLRPSGIDNDYIVREYEEFEFITPEDAFNSMKYYNENNILPRMEMHDRLVYNTSQHIHSNFMAARNKLIKTMKGGSKGSKKPNKPWKSGKSKKSRKMKSRKSKKSQKTRR